MPENKLLKVVFQLLPFAMVAMLIVVFLFTGNEFSVETILSYTPENYFLATVFILILFAAKSVSPILPVSVLNTAVGCIFPIIPALALNTVGIAVCIAISYWIGYFSTSDYVEKQMSKHSKIQEIVQKQRKSEWFVSYFLRVLPISCDLVSIYLGSLKTSFHKYFIAGMIGSLPGIISSTLFGVSINDPFSPMCIISFSAILLLSLISYLIYKYVEKKTEESAKA